MQIENPSIFLAALKEPVNLFLGAGFSVLARDRQGCQLPIGSALGSELRAKFNLEHLANLDLARLCTIIGRTDLDGLRDFLVDRFTVEEFDKRYTYLEKLQISTIFTTNIDSLVHRIFEESIKHYINDANVNGPEGLARSE